MTTNVRSQKKPSDDMELPFPKPPEPPSAARFPSWEEVVQMDREQATAPPRRRLLDLFDGILGDLTPLLADYSRHPEKYGAETHDLLERLRSGSISLEQLSTSERRLLNLATYDFAQATPPKKQKQSQAARAASKGETRAAKKKEPGPRPGIDVPVTELPAYWWLQ